MRTAKPRTAQTPPGESRHRRRQLAVLVSVALGAAMLQPLAAPALAATPHADGRTPLTAAQEPNDTIDPAEMLGDGAITGQAPATQGDVLVSGVVAISHTIDIAIVSPSGSAGGTVISDSGAVDLVARTGAYWKTQSNNQVLSLTATGPTPARYATARTCDDVLGIWEEAAARFGHAVSYYLSAAGHHLSVLVPNGCGGAGVGTVGTSLNPVSAADGGFIWASLNGVNNLDIVAHEFGHNLGLQHSNAILCADPTFSEGFPLTAATPTIAATWSDGCTDEPYQDGYDVMGAAFSYNGVANVTPTALNVNHKTLLGSLTSGEVQTVVLASGQLTQTVVSTISTTGASTGLRALAVTDPRTKHVYWVDYRGGTGMDSGSLYTLHRLVTSGIDNGVRVITSRDDGTSVVLQSPSPGGGSKLFLAAGQNLATRSGGIRVVVQGIDAANATATIAVTVTASSVERQFGEDRFATSAAISAANFGVDSPVVYIANGLNFPDALSAAPVAGAAKAPILLVQPGSIPAVVQAELRRLHPTRFVVLGSQTSVGDAVVEQLKQVTRRTGDPVTPVDRLYGGDRFATSAAISAANFAADASVVYIANGLNFPDALSAAPVAGAANAPILLVTAGSVPAVVQTELKRLHPMKFVVLGGLNSVGDAVVEQLKQVTRRTGDPVTPVDRLFGDDRFATSAAISRANFPLGAPVVYIANGLNFPDALSAAPVAGAAKAPILLVQPGGLPAAVLAELSRLHPKNFVVLGSPNSVSDSVVAQLDALVP